MRILRGCLFTLICLAVWSPRAAAQASAGAPEKFDGSSAATKPANVQPGVPAAKPAKEPDTASLETEIQQLREILASQSLRLQSQDESLRAEREQVRVLENQLDAMKSAADSAPAAALVSPDVSPASPSSAAPDAPAKPTFIPAITPIRVLPFGGIKREALKPAFELGSVRVTPYGFLKATFIHDSSSPNGDDFPLPGFSTDTGPNAAPEFHLKARSSRFGSNFEWIDPSSRITITGKVEMDFEGNFARVDNRNLSSIRSSMLSLRLAYGRIDYNLTDNDTISALFGQDWTPFSSSTLPNLLETTGLGAGFGTLYERDPQFRFGYTHKFSVFQVENEFAVVMPASGDVPAAANLANQLGYGERQGPDSARPGIQDRIVFQWQLDHAPGVAPAQVIFSGEQGRRQANVLAAAVPAAFKAAFPTGATVSSVSDGWTSEYQLPTRFFTLVGKYYSGSDLRWFFGGQLYSNFNDVSGLTGTASALSVDGASTVIFGLLDGVPVVAPQRPVRAAGGFSSLGIPISRLLGADPEGRNMGWTVFFTYGTDQAKTRDLLQLNPAGSRARSDMSVGTIYYKLNNWVTFAFEESIYRTRANTAAPGFPLFEGVPQHEWRDLRAEGGTIFSF